MVALECGITWKQRRANQMEHPRLNVRNVTIVVFKCPANLSDNLELKMFIRTAATMMMAPM